MHNFNSYIEAQFEAIRDYLECYVEPCSILERWYTEHTVTMNYVISHQELPNLLQIPAYLINLFINEFDCDQAPRTIENMIYAHSLTNSRVNVTEFKIRVKRYNTFLKCYIL